jgi:hypothetical protein
MGGYKMEREPVQSSNLCSVGYDPDTLTLEIEFKEGNIYQYYGVPESLYVDLMSAGSKGSFFHYNIRKAGYPYAKI